MSRSRSSRWSAPTRRSSSRLRRVGLVVRERTDREGASTGYAVGRVGELVADDKGAFRCDEGHDYTVVGLALTTNIAALRALWMAIRALEEDAASLQYMAVHDGDDYGLPAQARRAEADAALAAAELLRGHAARAQRRLDALPVAPLAVRADPGAGEQVAA